MEKYTYIHVTSEIKRSRKFVKKKTKPSSTVLLLVIASTVMNINGQHEIQIRM